MRSIFSVLRAVGLTLLLSFLAVPVSAECELPADLRTDDRPDLAGPPTEVVVNILVLDFLGVDDANQQIEVDLAFTATWRDPRMIGLEGCRFPVSSVWFPSFFFTNSSQLRLAFREARNQISVEDNGEILFVQRATGWISSYHNLRRFPFDHQDFVIEIAMVGQQADEVVFVADNENSALSKRLNVEGWRVTGIEVTDSIEKLELLKEEISLLALTISADRVTTYYVVRLLVPLMFVVAMSWSIFWVPPTRYEFQIGLGATAMLTIIAFTLSIANRLPNLGYLTALDKMLVWAVILVFLTIAEALLTGILVLRDREGLAKRIDRISRFAFPLLLVSGWSVVAF